MKKVGGWIILILAVLFALGLCTMFAHGSTVAARPNSLELSQVYDNPNTYFFGEPTDVTQMQDGRERVYTNVRFSPYNTAALYDQSILFCGDVADKFTKVPLIVTYTTRSGLMFKGIACHQLISVFGVQ